MRRWQSESPFLSTRVRLRPRDDQNHREHWVPTVALTNALRQSFAYVSHPTRWPGPHCHILSPAPSQPPDPLGPQHFLPAPRRPVPTMLARRLVWAASVPGACGQGQVIQLRVLRVAAQCPGQPRMVATALGTLHVVPGILTAASQHQTLNCATCAQDRGHYSREFRTKKGSISSASGIQRENWFYFWS